MVPHARIYALSVDTCVYNTSDPKPPGPNQQKHTEGLNVK